jgi:hypothetical protein
MLVYKREWEMHFKIKIVRFCEFVLSSNMAVNLKW